MSLGAIEEALSELRAGNMIIVVDDEDRENEGDLLLAAEKVTPDAINFMTREGRGLVCVPLPGAQLDALGLPLMVPTARNTSPTETAFAVAVDARCGITTGISAYDRATTVRLLADPTTRPGDLVRPGHIFPLRAQAGGVLVRPGHTEAAVDLARLAGLEPAGVICEVLAEDGSMARRPELEDFAKIHGLKMISIDDLVSYRLRTEQILSRLAETRVPTPQGEFSAIEYEDHLQGSRHLALVLGNPAAGGPPLVRIHARCQTVDVVASLHDDRGPNRDQTLEMIREEGRGVVLYLAMGKTGPATRHEWEAGAGQQEPPATRVSTNRDGLSCDHWDNIVSDQILADLGLSEVRLLTNDPCKGLYLGRNGVRVVEVLPLIHSPSAKGRDPLRKEEGLEHSRECSEELFGKDASRLNCER